MFGAVRSIARGSGALYLSRPGAYNARHDCNAPLFLANYRPGTLIELPGKGVVRHAAIALQNSPVAKDWPDVV